MHELKVVIDSNIIVTILKGFPSLSYIYSAFKNGRFKLVISDELLKELAYVLARPRLHISAADIKELFRLIKMRAVRVNLGPEIITICRDHPKDNFILQLAVESKADFIVTGDKDLLVLSPFRGIAIIKLKEFNTKLEALE